MRDPERGAGSYTERGTAAGTGTGTGSNTAGSGSAWQYRSIPYEGEDRDKTTARREMEARASSSSSSSGKAMAFSNNDNYNSFSMYGRDADVMRGSDSKTTGSSIRGEKDRDRDFDGSVPNKQHFKIEEERTQLPRGSSFREEKAMVSGTYDAAGRGAGEPYPSSDVSAASKEAFGQGQGVGMGMRKSSSNQVPPGFQIPLEQKVCQYTAVHYCAYHRSPSAVSV
jgi:hypothetical protein